MQHRPIHLALALLAAVLCGQPAHANEDANTTALSRPLLSTPQLVAQVTHSVYMLGVEDEAGAFTPGGTGWVIAPGILATNGHVAEELQRRAQRGTLVAKRTWSSPSLSLAEDSMQIHPTYAEWGAEFGRKRSGVGDATFIAPADLALIHVKSGTTGAPLSLAAMEPGAIALGSPAIYVGYPHENRVGRPTQQVLVGNVTALCDPLFESAEWKDATLVHVSLPVCGGASGSPLFNLYGEVIGVMSAADHVHGPLMNRVPLTFGYAQRIDVLQELLGDEQGDVIQGRHARWRARFEREGIGAHLATLERFTSAASLYFELFGRTVDAFEDSTIDPSDESARQIQLTVPPGTFVAVSVIASPGEDIDLVARAEDGEELARDAEADHYPVVMLGAFSSERRVSLQVVGGERRASGNYHVRIIRSNSGEVEQPAAALDDVPTEGPLFYVAPGGGPLLSALLSLCTSALHVVTSLAHDDV